MSSQIALPQISTNKFKTSLIVHQNPLKFLILDFYFQFQLLKLIFLVNQCLFLLHQILPNLFVRIIFPNIGLYYTHIHYHPLSSINLLPLYHLLLRYQVFNQFLIFTIPKFQGVLHFRISCKLSMLLIIDTVRKSFGMVLRLVLSLNLFRNLHIRNSIGLRTLIDWLLWQLTSIALFHFGLKVSLKLIPRLVYFYTKVP